MKFIIACLMLVFASACGTDSHTYDRPPVTGPPPGGGGGTPGGDLSYAEMNGLLQNYCAACHASAQFMQSESALLASSAKNRIWNESMPPSNAGKKLPDTERALMLTFF